MGVPPMFLCKSNRAAIARSRPFLFLHMANHQEVISPTLCSPTFKGEPANASLPGNPTIIRIVT